MLRRLVAGYDFAGASNIAWINGYDPFVSFDPGADGVPDALYSIATSWAQIESRAINLTADTISTIPSTSRMA